MKLLNQATRDRFFIALAVISAAAYLFGLAHPRQVVFDEVHFGKFVTAYCCTGERFFDIHPPHAKLVTAGVAWLGGYRGGFSFQRISQEYQDVPVTALRLPSAAAGALIPLLVFLLMRAIRVSPEIAFLAGLFFALDNALVAHSRLIALDSMLLAAILGALLVFFLAEKHEGKYRPLWFLAAGGLAGFAVGTKFTGLTALGLLGLLVLHRVMTGKKQKDIQAWLGRGLLVLAGALVVYTAGWWLHYSLLPHSGSGDAWQVPTGNFAEDVIYMHRRMLSANYNLSATHSYSSQWWTWPFMQRPVFYWNGSDGGKIYFLGNPVVWWGGSVLFIASLFSLLSSITRPLHKRVPVAGMIFLAGYVISYAPLMRVPRALFMYHYLMPLLFSVLFGFAWLDSQLRSAQVSVNIRARWYVAVVALLIGGFVLFSPLTYGFVADAWQKQLFFFSSWR